MEEIVSRSLLEAECPLCNRVEQEFETKAEAQAWLTGHILEEHADELPDLEGI